jgi:hypothetical protein
LGLRKNPPLIYCATDCTYKVIWSRGNKVYYVFWMSVALVFQHAKRTCLITLSSAACPVYHSSLLCLINGTIFGKSYEYKVFVLIFSETFLILKTIQRGMYVHTSSCKVPVILVRFSSNLAFLDRFSKNPQMSNFIKIRPVEAELFHADGQTDEQAWRS